jgi:hypothetical protein
MAVDDARVAMAVEDAGVVRSAVRNLIDETETCSELHSRKFKVA